MVFCHDHQEIKICMRQERPNLVRTWNRNLTVLVSLKRIQSFKQNLQILETITKQLKLVITPTETCPVCVFKDQMIS